MRKVKSAQPESQRRRRTTFSRLEVFRRGRRSGATQRHTASIVESGVQEGESVDRSERLHEENPCKSPEESESVVFPPFPPELMKSTPEDFVLPDEYIRDQKNETDFHELMSPSPKSSVTVSFQKENINNSNLPDTVPIENIPLSLLNNNYSLKVSFGKENVNNSDIADTIPIENFSSALMKLSPEKVSFGKENVNNSDIADTVPLAGISSALVKMSPEKVSFVKENVNNSDQADTIPTENISSALLKMSPEKKHYNPQDTRTVSPILLCKPTVARSHLYSRRMKGLCSSVRSKRTIPKQIPLVLDHEIMAKINENLPELSQIDDNTTLRKEKHASVSTMKEADEDKDFFHSKKMSYLSKFKYCSLEVINGGVLAAFCEHEVVIVVQDSLVTFHTIKEQSSNRKLTRNEIQPSEKQIFTFAVSTNGSICTCIELVLASQSSKDEHQLMVMIYTFNQLTESSNVCSIRLLELPKHVCNLKICPVQDNAFVVCWSKDNNTSTQIMKFCMDNQFQGLLKSTEMNTINGCVNSLHALTGCEKVIVGATSSAVTIWDLHSGHVLKTLDFEGLVWNSYLWCNEDKGFLFSAVEIDRNIEITAANLTTGKFKMLRQYPVPESFSQSSGLHVEHGLVIATYPEGFIVWELISSKVVLKVTTDLQLFLCKDNIICVTPNRDTSDIDLRVLDITKLQ